MLKIRSVFNGFNFKSWAPGPNEAYKEMGERMENVGYGKS